MLSMAKRTVMGSRTGGKKKVNWYVWKENPSNQVCQALKKRTWFWENIWTGKCSLASQELNITNVLIE